MSAFVSGSVGVSARRERWSGGEVCGGRQARHMVCRRVQTVAPARSGMRMMGAGKAIEIDKDAFEKLVAESSGTPILVDFFAVWCGPCKLMAPLMDWAVSLYGDKLKVVKIDTEKNPSFVKQYKIYGLPTLVIFKDGESVAQVEGAMSKQAIQDFISENVPELATV
mmetsp:Transcript_12682/g.27657  ORF Transcript_12682/g.27657 Transcript_12682/m.27657 type:complete len:166 (-) Transcript_12682:740-1237(-)|eukprot:CAMPEP_0185847288 /NCGR_PEP_ID=MMETSP1354-20130828/2611_1 /TAXON_ID=708628 /ORGANISM="Erythrolobus madagascarensis, Strain CCMP3276" /LENGTH=165 /DNA_ID=CAMNT_0028547559 /DNA_START=67 /DNA_END=564 /DNA_ORIENTATION=-